MPEPPHLRLVRPGETAPDPAAEAAAALVAALGLDERAAGRLAAALVGAVRAAVRAEASVSNPRPSSPYDRLTSDEVQAELRIGKTAYYKLLQANVLRQLTDPTAGTVFVTRAELDRYKRETGTRTGPRANPRAISNAPARRRAA